jgi:endothelin-converting enzyme
MNMAQIEKLVPEIDMSRFLKAQLPPSYTINRVNVYTSAYFKSLSSILKAADRKTLHDYFEWGLARAWFDSLHKDFTTPLAKFQTAKGVKDQGLSAERWKTCTSEMDTELGWIGSAIFVQRAFSPEAKALGERIVGELKTVYTEKLQATPNWRSDAAKAAALKKSKIPTFVRSTRFFFFFTFSKFNAYGPN